MNVISNFTNTAVLAAPIILWLFGLLPAHAANRNAKFVSRIGGVAAWCAFAFALIAAFTFGYDRAHSLTLYSVSLPGNYGAFSISTYINTLTIIMLLLVSFVGAIVTRYARNYLDGDPQQGRFHKWLAMTLASILTLIISGNLLMFSLAWIATSLCLHQLLMFYKQRPAAILAAHKKFVASRIGDASLLTAIFLIGSTLHTLEFKDLYQLMSDMQGPMPLALSWASILIILSAALKSAQFPFHGWLIQVMEAPTPVSALLHAGIVNAGAFLVLRMSPIVSHSATALGLLAIVGLTTLALASLVMLTQTSIKVSLAWSTTAQMGFMLLECGLGLYSLAMLHLVAHSLYKGHAFLASGSGVDNFRAPALAYAKDRPQAWQHLLAFVFAVLLTLGVGTLFGLDVTHQPALFAAGAVVAIAMTQLLFQSTSQYSSLAFLLRALGLTIIVSIAYFALHELFARLLIGSVVPVRETATVFQLALVALIVAVFLGLLSIQQAFKSGQSQRLERLYVHLYNGLYIDVFITRMLQRVWPAPLVATTQTNGG